MIESPEQVADELDDPRVIQAAQEYLHAVESGSRPDRQEFLTRHSDIATPLAECIDAMEMVHAVGSRMEEPQHQAIDPKLPLGDFRIIREIGRGGMGVVYEAEQLSLGRRTALKVLPFAMNLDPRQLQRFKTEARAAAQLHHPNIVPVYSVGCERGVHYFAMQFIDGRPLSQIIHELKHPGFNPEIHPEAFNSQCTTQFVECKPIMPAAEPQADTVRDEAVGVSTERSIRGRSYFHDAARLIMQAAEALEHAHEQGVIHRDVKPGNLLVDQRGHLWVADFGLAHIQSDVAMTASGDLIGTLRYMSPEQGLAKRGLIDHRTDIYALGATLYELLTLRPVFDGRDRQEILKQIAFEEPRSPRRWNPKIPADLETIVLKALAKNIEDRYLTAAEFAADLRRFLDDQPIEARRPSLLERSFRWARRHRVAVACGVLALCLASVGFAVSTALIAREQRATKTAYNEMERAYKSEARQRQLADENFEKARQMLDFVTLVATEDMADRQVMLPVRRKLLEAALVYYQDFIDQRKNDPTIRVELAESYLRVAGILHEIGDSSKALEAMKKAVALQETVLKENPEDQEAHKRLTSMYQGLSSFRNGALVALLYLRSVQKELKLSEAQTQKITAASDYRRDAFRDTGNFKVEDWERVLGEVGAKERDLMEQLEPTQLQRLRQINWQQKGVAALQDPEVAMRLKLSKEQREKLEILSEARQLMMARMWKGGERPSEDSWKTQKEQALAVLSQEQRDEYKVLLGDTFRGEMRHGRPWWPGPSGHHYHRGRK